MKRLHITQKLVYEKFYVHEKILRKRNSKSISNSIYQKFTSWKTQKKHVNQTTTIQIAIERTH